MISVLVLSERGAEALAVTLAALVAGVAQGLVSDAVVLTREPREDVAAVADAVGAKLVVVRPGEDPWRAGAAVGRRDWMLCLEAGDLPQDGWVGALERFVGLGAAERDFARLQRGPEPAVVRLAKLAESLTGARRPRPGDLVGRNAITARRGLGRPRRLTARLQAHG
jgi:hypothetical protein